MTNKNIGNNLQTFIICSKYKQRYYKADASQRTICISFQNIVVCLALVTYFHDNLFLILQYKYL